jgi:hypothetical protein
VLLAACAAPASRNAADVQNSATATVLVTLHRQDELWMDRVGFGLDTQIVADYRHLGRERFLAQQLDARDNSLPAEIASQIDVMEISRLDPARQLAQVQASYKSINAMPDGADKEQAISLRIRPSGVTCCAPSIRPRSCRSRWSGSGSITSVSTSTRAICAG